MKHVQLRIKVAQVVAQVDNQKLSPKDAVDKIMNLFEKEVISNAQN